MKSTANVVTTTVDLALVNPARHWVGIWIAVAAAHRDVFFDPKTHLSFALPHNIQDFADGFGCYFQRSTVRVEWQKSADGINSYRAFAKCSEKGGSYRTKQIEGRMVR